MKRLQSWKVSDDFWMRVEQLIPKRQRDSDKNYKRKSGGGRKPQDQRKVFEGILYVLRTGCQWKAVPKIEYGSGSSIHKYFLEWQATGLFEELWRASLLEYDELEGIAWDWQSLDGMGMGLSISRSMIEDHKGKLTFNSQYGKGSTFYFTLPV